MNRPEFLAALARADESQSAAPEVEQALLQAFRRRHRSIWIRRASGWGALAAAVALVWIAVRPAAKPVRQQISVIDAAQCRGNSGATGATCGRRSAPPAPQASSPRGGEARDCYRIYSRDAGPRSVRKRPAGAGETAAFGTYGVRVAGE